MRGRTQLALIIIFLGLTVAIAEIVYSPMVILDKNALVFTVHGKLVAASFVIAICAFIFAIIDELVQGQAQIDILEIVLLGAFDDYEIF